MINNYIKSPMNYIGGKYKILNQILPLFPKDIECFIDLFSGGCNVGVNVSAKKIICNDIIHYIIELYEYFKNNALDVTLQEIENVIDKYSLSMTNDIGYKTLRDSYNENKSPLLLFVLICYSFNHQIRYNNSHKFSTPFGRNRSCYNENIKTNLKRFIDTIKAKDITFTSCNFKNMDFSQLTHKDFVYCDPPYLITVGSYNDGKRGFEGWGYNEEIYLLNLLDSLHKQNIRFALSNVLKHKGKENKILLEWLSDNSITYNIHHLSTTYANSSNHCANINNRTSDEVLITNY